MIHLVAVSVSAMYYNVLFCVSFCVEDRAEEIAFVRVEAFET